MKKKKQAKTAPDSTKANKQKDEIFGFLKGQGVILGHIEGPALTKEEWGSLWPEDDE